MSTTKTNIPKLRFPEFIKVWAAYKLSDVANIITGSTPSTFIPEYYGGDKHFVSPADIQENRYIYQTKTLLTDLGFSKTRKIKKGSILFVCIGSTIGKVGQATQDCSTNQQLNSLESKEGNNNDFIYSLLERKANKIRLLAGVQAVPQINKSDFSTLKYYFPEPIEQQKIASFLIAVDTKIEQLTKKKKLLEQYKKGVMRQIFSQELSFKDENGNDFPDWNEKKLGEIGITLNGLTGKTKEDFGRGKPYVQYKQIFDNSKIDINKCDFVEILENENQSKVQYGDVFFTTSSETPHEIGTASVLLDEVEEMYLNSFCFGYRVDTKILNPSFAQFLFRSEGFRKKMIPLAQGSTRYNVSKSSFMKLSIQLPSIAEQNQIANFLCAIVSKIELVNTQIENTRRFKKGLLQQLFV